MDFDIPPEDMALRDEVRRFAERQLAPVSRGYDEAAAFPGESMAGLARMGLMGLNVPEEYGGVGASPLGIVLVIEELTAACAGTASAIGAHYLATDSLLIGGDEAIRRRFLVPASAGEKLGAYALTEPEAGSDPNAMRTRATPEGDGYRLRGTKHFITNGGEADFVVVFARTDPEAAHRGISAFVVEKGAPGFRVERNEEIMGIRASRIYELSFDCHVPRENMVGAPGQGFRIAMGVLDRGRVDIAAMSLGLGGAALRAAVAWARARSTFGRPIADYQGIQWMLADMDTMLEASRLLTYQAAWRRARNDGRYSREAAMAKLFASEAAGKIADLALQIHGGYGYSRALPLERYVRDARILRIFEGTSEMQRNIIARHLLAEAGPSA